jgi:hypothetical protein
MWQQSTILERFNDGVEMAQQQRGAVHMVAVDRYA